MAAPLRRILRLGLLAVSLSGAVAEAAVIVEAVQAPAGLQSPLEVGDELLRWSPSSTSGQPATEFRHWAELDLLPLLELPKGPLEIDFSRGGARRHTVVPAAAWTFQGRPTNAGPELLELVAGFSSGGSTTVAPGVGAAELERRLAGRPDEIRSWVWTRFAEAAGKRADWETARIAYGRAVTASPRKIAAHLGRLHGDAQRRVGQLDEAEKTYRAALDAWSKIEPDGLGASLLLNSLGNLHAGQDDLASASRYFEEAARIRRRVAPRSWLYANVLSSLGMVAGRRNDLASAEKHLLESLALAEQQGGDPAPALANLGIVTRLRGDLDRSEVYTRRAIDLLRAAGNSREAARKLINLGNVLGDAGRAEEAFSAFDEAWALLDGSAPDRSDLVSIRANRARIFQDTGNFRRASTEIAAARALDDFDKPRTGVELLITSLEAREAEERGDLDAATRFAELTLEGRTRIQPDSSFEAEAASALAAILDARGRPDEAERSYRRSIRALERQQEQLGGGDRGLVAFRSRHSGIYRAFQEFLLRHGRPDEAFEIYERSRAQALLALLQQRDLELADADLNPAVARTRRQLGARIDQAYLEMAKLPATPAADGQRQALRQSIEALHEERERLNRSARDASPRLRAIETPPAYSLAEIRQTLAADTLVLAYSLGPASSTLFALSGTGGVEAFPIAASEAGIAADVRRWSELVSGSTLRRAELGAVERRLSQLLLGPAATQLRSAARLLIIPDGAIHTLAFAALPDPQAPDSRLLERLPVSYQVSASVQAELQQKRPAAAPDRVAVFADPTSSAAATAQFRREFGRLPATRREAESLYHQLGERVHLFLGDAATESAARGALATATVSHFATHAVVDEALPLDSALLLAPDADGTGAREGLLQAWEIAAQVREASDLVVLSACETARGADRGGEGILGLVRALQVAGARSVVASLWRVDDESTAELMSRFHRHLSAGLARDEALRQAQLELLRGPVRIERDGRTVELRTSDPRFWAPFVLIGPVH
ncbi:MAG: CHAT domain-containing protein [Thermoanaerobaculia bacterium]